MRSILPFGFGHPARGGVPHFPDSCVANSKALETLPDVVKGYFER
jgi:hypothetical protein